MTAHILNSKAALRHNLSVLQKRAGSAKIWFMVKANGYGHGMVDAARTALPHVGAFGVARLSEALQLRQAGIEAPIWLMSGIQSPDELSTAQAANIGLVIHNASQLNWLAFASADKPVAVWVKLNTGMNRLGIPVAELSATLEHLAALPVTVAGLMTHFANAGDGLSDESQLEIFLQATNAYQYPRSVANSPALLKLPGCTFDWVRPGLAGYGISPFNEEPASHFGLTPVMQLQATVLDVRQLAAGESVGYGLTYQATHAHPMAVINLGYGDGLPWRPLAKGHLKMQGVSLPLIGRLSMDMCAVDCSAHELAIGDTVPVIHSDLSVNDWAKSLETSPYELTTQLSERLTRVWE